VMKRDLKKLRKTNKGKKLVTKFEWIQQTLR